MPPQKHTQLPLLDGLRYGKFFLPQFPAFATLLLPLDPIIRLYFSFPFAGLILFFGVYLVSPLGPLGTLGPLRTLDGGRPATALATC